MSIVLLYTGAQNFDTPQIEASKSLGGFVSSSIIQNDVLNNLFGDITNYTIQKSSSDTKCIAIKNTGPTITDLTIYYESPVNSLFDYFIGAVSPTTNECNESIFEQLQNSESSPYYCTFYNPNTELTKINVGNIAADGYLGLFIKRKFKQSVIDNTDFCSTQTIEDLQNQSKLETVKLYFNWS